MGRKDKVWHYFTIATLSTATLMFLIYAYMVIFPLTPILEVKSAQILNTKVMAGDNIQLKAETCKNHRYSATVTRRLTNSIIVLLPSIEANQGLGCKTEVFSIQIPTEIAPGTYYFSAQFTYEVNQFNTKVYDMKTNTFEVVKE